MPLFKKELDEFMGFVERRRERTRWSNKEAGRTEALWEIIAPLVKHSEQIGARLGTRVHQPTCGRLVEQYPDSTPWVALTVPVDS